MTGRLLALDGLRGLLALYVLAGHTAPFLRLAGPLGWIGGALSHGRAAVDLFFVLSGMVILRSLDGGRPARGGAVRFLAARAGRLLPIYGIAVGLAAIALCPGDPFRVMPWLPSGGAARDIAEAVWPQPWFAHLAAHATLTQGLLPPALLPDAEFSILGPAWSLSTEWQFYLLVAAVLALAARQGPHRHNRFGPPSVCKGDSDRNRSGYSDGNPHRLRASVPLFVSGLLLLGLFGLSVDLLPQAWRLGRAFLPREAGYFALGVASHGLLAAGGRGSARQRSARLWYALALLAAAGLSWAETRLAAAVVPLAWSLCLLCEAPVVPRALRPLRMVLTARPILWLGAISYPLYLIHAPVQRLLMLALAPGADGHWAAFSLLWGPPAILLPIVAAYALHRWVEVPCWRWSRRLAAGPGTPRGTGKQALLFAKRSKNSHPPIDGGSGSNTEAAGRP